MKRAILRLTPECLQSILAFRNDVRIVDASFDRKHDIVELHLHGNGLPESTHVGEGADAVWATVQEVCGVQVFQS